MRIKKDFVTNSSSTSFIITCETQSVGKSDFIELFNNFLKDYIQKNRHDEDFQEPPLLTNEMVKEIEEGVYTITDFAPIYCGDADTPQYIEELFMDGRSEFYKALNKAGIRVKSTDLKDFNEM